MFDVLRPNNNPRLSIGARNQVTVDAGGKIHLIDDLEEYRKTVGTGTWNAVIKLAENCARRKSRLDSSHQPHKEMRHALIRFLTALDVDVAWSRVVLIFPHNANRYVPNPSPQVFRTTKNNHNILQGVAAPDLRLTQEAKDAFDAWILKNGLRWTAEGGSRAWPDDPQMPGLIPLIKKVRPEVPIVYRSHIEIRSDLVHVAGSPQEEVWKYLWNNIQLADYSSVRHSSYSRVVAYHFLTGHPVSKFVPSDVPTEKLALLGAATDCSVAFVPKRRWLNSTGPLATISSRCPIDPSKGIPNVVDSYYKFRNLLRTRSPEMDASEHPQLLICGHGAVDDPDASIIYDQIMALVNSDPYKEYSQDIVVMRLPPSDERKSLPAYLLHKY
ncbi:Trehalose phosphorylase [Salix suchowensis]|nr:Trehalose phosphorylase [Salix suchowensis]